LKCNFGTMSGNDAPLRKVPTAESGSELATEASHIVEKES